MYWEIRCYNDTVFKSLYGETLTSVLNRFKQETGLHEMDIKYIKNLS